MVRANSYGSDWRAASLVNTLERLHGGIGHFDVLSACAAAYADSPDEDPFFDKRDASAQDDDSSLIRRVDAEGRAAGKRCLRQIGCRHFHRHTGPCFVDSDIDSGDSRIIHPVQRDEVRPFVHNSDYLG